LQFLVKHISKIAEEGDVIVLSENNVICAEDLENLDVVKRLKLSISSEKGSFNGGIYLKGKISDKDLSFAAIISEAKEEYVKEIAENLFGIL
jgi:vacuolar-type H+-ATPase subunit E/Vma4